MVTLSTSGNSVQFTFTNCPTYLQNGSIETPKNSLSLTIDSSNMATFKKAASNDIFVSVSLNELGMTKDELIEYYQDNMTSAGGGGGGSEEEIQELSGKVQTISGQVSSNTADINTLSGTVSDKADSSAVTEEITAAVSGKADSSSVTADIAAAVSGKADSSAVTEEITAAVSGKADSSAVTEEIASAVSGKADSSAVTEEITAAVSGKADTSALTEHTGDSTIHVTSQDKTNWDAKADISDITDAISGKADSSAVTEEITAAVSGKADSSSVTEEITAAVSGKADSSSVTEEITAAVSGKADTSALTAVSNDVSTLSGTVTAHTADTDIHVTSQDKTNWDAKADANDIEDAISGKADSSAVTEEITAAVSGKADSSSVTADIAAAVSGKQDTLVSGTNIKTVNNESLLGSGNITISGGGSTYSAGTGINISGDVISLDLPLSGGSYGNIVGISSFGDNHAGMLGFSYGAYNDAYGAYSVVFGRSNSASSDSSYGTITGFWNKTKNQCEFATGRFNSSSYSSSTFGDSGNTLFSVGNGTSDNDLHNAIEIRQNGDIYITSGGTDILLQDHLGGGGSQITIDPTLDSGSTNPVANSAITAAIEAISVSCRFTENVEQTIATAINDLYDTKADASGLTALSGQVTASTSDISTLSGQVTSLTSDLSTVSSATASNTTALGGIKLVKLTRQQYEQLSNKDSNTLYIIPDE